MAENKRPFIAVDNPPRHINLATINKQKKSMASNNSSDHLSVVVDTTRMQLISPPPEEMLRPVNPSSHATTTAAKRKRTQPSTTTFSSTPLYSRDVNSTSFNNDLTTQTSQQQPIEATPNPKPRKQGRLHSRQPSLESPTGTSYRHLGSSPVFNGAHTPYRSKTKMVQVKSPHPNIPDADFIDVPALVLPTRRKNLQSARSSRRSATPLIPYEPPTDVFTPPREVFLSPVTKSSKRKTVASASSFKSAKGKRKGSTLTIVTAVKQELPDIDLTLPMPPPSPSDDPLLLLGPSEFDFLSEPTPPRKREMSVQVQAIDEDLLPPSSPIAMDEEEAVGVFDWDRNNNNDIVSDISTDDEGEEEAEEQEVRRMSVEPEQLMELNEEAEEREVRRMSIEPEQLLELNEEEEEHEVRQMSIEPEQFLELNEEAEEQEVRRMSVEPEQLLKNDEEEQEVRRMSVEPERLLKNEEEEEEEEEQEVRRMSVEPEWLLKNEEEEEEEEEEQEVRRMSIEPEQSLKNEEEEEHEIRQISVEVDNDEELARPFDNLDRLPLQYTENPACGNQAAFRISYCSEQDEDDQISDDSDELSHDIVKITSADPRSAARAAAILKQHDYDCYTNIEIKQRHQEAKHRRKSDIEDSVKESRRRDVFSSGVAKVSNSRRRSRSALSMGVIGDSVFIPGSPAMTLPELLQEAELEMRDSPWISSQRSSVLPTRGDPFLTPIAAKYRVQTADQKVEVYSGDGGEREWTKEDWKHLDACFTDQRLEVGSRLAGSEQNMLASVDMVSIDDVVDKFVISKGGFETITRFGELWSRENLLERTRALQKKQRSGNIARPTTPCTPLSVVKSNGDDGLGEKDSRVLRMQIPDFTPLARRATLPRKSRLSPALPQSDPDQKEPIVMPPTLLAPRYSHLLEEAIAISQEVSTLSPEQETFEFPQSEINDTSSDISSTIAISERGLTLSPEQETFLQSEVKDTSHSSDVPSTTIGKRVKGLLFSYLPTLPKLSVSKAPPSVQPTLPLPPIEILSKPRGPITTPARAPILKPKHPKELVVLHPAPQPPTISHIPRLKKPQRLVELHPPAPLPVIEQPNPIPRPRRSSGSSVKDLVRGFEEIQAVTRDKLKYNVGWKTYTGDKKRPQWKP